jgi:hypothetical protein
MQRDRLANRLVIRASAYGPFIEALSEKNVRVGHKRQCNVPRVLSTQPEKNQWTFPEVAHMLYASETQSSTATFFEAA